MTPYRRSAAIGEHDIVLHKTGFADYLNTIDVQAGRGSAFDAVLRAEVPPALQCRRQQPPSAKTSATRRGRPCSVDRACDHGPRRRRGTPGPARQKPAPPPTSMAPRSQPMRTMPRSSVPLTALPLTRLTLPVASASSAQPMRRTGSFGSGGEAPFQLIVQGGLIKLTLRRKARAELAPTASQRCRSEPTRRGLMVNEELAIKSRWPPPGAVISMTMAAPSLLSGVKGPWRESADRRGRRPQRLRRTLGIRRGHAGQAQAIAALPQRDRCGKADGKPPTIDAKLGAGIDG